jgi:hypothetical protein
MDPVNCHWGWIASKVQLPGDPLHWYGEDPATDNCPGLTKTQAPAAGTVMTVVHNQSINVVITAKDAAGNTATCGRIVKAKDVTPPTITTCPANRTVGLSRDCKITVPDMRYDLVATDCSLPLTVTQSPAQGTVLPSDAYDVFYVTMTVKDAAGNTSMFRYRKNVRDGSIDFMRSEFAQAAFAQLSILTLTCD